MNRQSITMRDERDALTAVRDDALVRAWQAGDLDAANVLLGRYDVPLRHFFCERGDAAVAADLAQRTLLACTCAIPRFRGHAPFRSFLFAIAYRIRCRHVHACYRERLVLTDVPEVEDAAFAGDRMAQLQQLRAVRGALESLPEEYREVLELHYWEDKSTREAAATLGIPAGTAKTRLRRARQLLERALDEGRLPRSA